MNRLVKRMNHVNDVKPSSFLENGDQEACDQGTFRSVGREADDDAGNKIRQSHWWKRLSGIGSKYILGKPKRKLRIPGAGDVGDKSKERSSVSSIRGKIRTLRQGTIETLWFL